MRPRVLGVPVSPVVAEDLCAEMVAIAAHSSTPPTTVLYANPHVLNTAYQNLRVHEELRRATIVYVDGNGVRIGARLLGFRLPPRLTAADWLDDFCSVAAAAGIGIYLLGGAAGVAAQAGERLAAKHPELKIVGTHHGFLDSTSSRTVVDRINAASADVVLVGMGTPVQELWIGKHRDEINAPVVWAVGALLDFVVGAQRRAPTWVRRFQLEWLWRLGTDPRRLWRRYVLGNPLFLARVLRERLLGLPSRLREVL